MATKSSGATAAMSNLTLNPSAKPKPKPKSKKAPVADSWEDEEDSDSEGTAGPASPRNDDDDSKPPSSGFAAPPPTPISPTSHSDAPWQSMTGSQGGLLGPDTAAERKRPEKTDAVARRMIASALGVKAPKQTDEQKAYDRALREQERKRRDAEREAERRGKEEAERAKAAIWDD